MKLQAKIRLDASAESPHRFFTVDEVRARGRQAIAELEAIAGRPLTQDELMAAYRRKMAAESIDKPRTAMQRSITIRYSESGKTNPKEWESSVTIDGEGADEDDAERDAIHKFKAQQGDVPYTVDRNAPAVTARTRLIATAELVEATSLGELHEKIMNNAQQMDRTPRGSPEYHALQFKMQRMLKELRQADPLWEESWFNPLVWSHSGKPPRSRPGVLQADLDKGNIEDHLIDPPLPTEDPLSTGVAFDTLIDGEEPSAAEPSVQTVTKDDGTIQEAPEQDLLNDDLVVPSIKFG